MRNEGTELSTLSMGACLDLLPVLANLLESKYEEYVNYYTRHVFRFNYGVQQTEANFFVSRSLFPGDYPGNCDIRDALLQYG